MGQTVGKPDQLIKLFHSEETITVKKVLSYLEPTTAKETLKSKDDDGNTPLHLALLYCSYNRLEIIKSLLTYGAAIVTENSKSITPLHLVLATGDSDLIHLFLTHKPKNSQLFNSRELLDSKGLCPIIHLCQMVAKDKKTIQFNTLEYFLQTMKNTGYYQYSWINLSRHKHKDNMSDVFVELLVAVIKHEKLYPNIITLCLHNYQEQCIDAFLKMTIDDIHENNKPLYCGLLEPNLKLTDSITEFDELLFEIACKIIENERMRQEQTKKNMSVPSSLLIYTKDDLILSTHAEFILKYIISNIDMNKFFDASYVINKKRSLFIVSLGFLPNDSKLITLLINGNLDPKAKAPHDTWNNNFLWASRYVNNRKILEALYDKNSEFEDTSDSMLAACEGHCDENILFLLEKNLPLADVSNIYNPKHCEIFQYLSENKNPNLKVIEALIKRNKENLSQAVDLTPIALKSGSHFKYEISSLLLKNGAPSNDRFLLRKCGQAKEEKEIFTVLLCLNFFKNKKPGLAALKTPLKYYFKDRFDDLHGFKIRLYSKNHFSAIKNSLKKDLPVIVKHDKNNDPSYCLYAYNYKKEAWEKVHTINDPKLKITLFTWEFNGTKKYIKDEKIKNYKSFSEALIKISNGQIFEENHTQESQMKICGNF